MEQLSILENFLYGEYAKAKEGRLYVSLNRTAEVAPNEILQPNLPLRAVVRKALQTMGCADTRHYLQVMTFDKQATPKDYDRLIELCRRYAKNWALV